MLYLIGLGLWDEKDLTVRGVETAKKCERVYLEAYTDKLGGLSKVKLEKMLGKQIVELDRADIEETPFFIPEAIGWDIALLVGGDPLVATTHSDLLLRCKEKGVECQVIHNASIYSAIAETGLQMYKFGKTATVVFWEDNFRPSSFYEAVKENSSRGLHTLLLLDIKKDKLMSPRHAIKTLIEIDTEFKEKKIVVMSRAGSKQPGMDYGRADELLSHKYGLGPHVLIVPGKLHPLEKEMLESLTPSQKRNP